MPGCSGGGGSIALPMGHAVLAGLAGMLAGVLHAPLTAILLTAEVSGGYALFVPGMLTSAISFRISKRWMKHTVYTRELAERGELLTHDKDQTILTLMPLPHRCVFVSALSCLHDDAHGLLHSQSRAERTRICSRVRCGRYRTPQAATPQASLEMRRRTWSGARSLS